MLNKKTTNSTNVPAAHFENDEEHKRMSYNKCWNCPHEAHTYIFGDNIAKLMIRCRITGNTIDITNCTAKRDYIKDK